MEEKIYILEKWGGIYCSITREELADLCRYVAMKLPTLENLVYKMIESNQMSAIYGQHLLRSSQAIAHVCWINIKELPDEEDEYFSKVYDMSFEFV